MNGMRYEGEARDSDDMTKDIGSLKGENYHYIPSIVSIKNKV